MEGIKNTDDILERSHTLENGGDGQARYGEASYHELIENADDIIFTHNLAENMTSFNKAAERLTGYTREEGLRLKISQIVAPEHLDLTREMTMRKLAGEQHPAYECAILTKDGRRVEIEVNSQLIRKDGEPVGVQGVARDIGARKRAERIQAATFRISEATLMADNFQELFKSIHEIIGELMPAPNLYVALLDETGETLSFPYYVDECDTPPISRKLGKGATEYVLRTGAPLQASPEVFKELTRRGETELIGAASADWFGVPLKTKDKTIGALVVQSYRKGVAFEENEKNILVFVSEQVAMAIERKLADEALREAEEKYRSIFENAVMGIFQSTPDGRFITANSALSRMLGYDSPEELTTGVSDIERSLYADPDRRAEFKQALEEQGFVRRFEKEVHRKDGEKIWIAGSARAVRNDGGLIQHYEGTVEDITDLKRAEQELRRSQENYATLVNSIDGIVWEADARTFEFLFVSLQAERLLGYPVQQWTTDPNFWASHIHPGDRAWAVDYCLNATRQKVDHQLEYRMIAADGREVWLNDMVTVVVENDQPAKLRGVMVDITSRKLMEEALRESESRYRLLFESNPLPMWLFDFETMSFLAVNDAAVHHYGYSRGEFLAMTIADIRPPDDRPALLNYLQNSADVLCELGTWRHLKKDGTVIDVEVTVDVLTLGSRRAGLVLANDVTERKRAEEERAQLLALERAARTEAEQMNKHRSELLEREQAARAEAEAAHREWQTTFDMMADSVLLADCDDRLIRANTAFFKSFGLAPEDSIGRSLNALLHEEPGRLPDGSKCPICELRSQRERGVVELPAGAVTGYPILTSVDPVLDSGGNIVGVVQVIRDQTDLYRARQEAERQRLSLDAVIEQMAEGLIVWDETRTVVRANQQAQRILGVTFEQMRRDFVLEGSFADEQEQVIGVSDLPIEIALREQRVADTRLWYTKPDGQRVFLLLTASPFFKDRGRLAGAILLVRDVTERRRRGERAQQADKLRALGQLASGVAHNFNNALASVLGYTQLALPKVDNPDVEKYLRVVEKSAKDAARMVERIQNFSRGSHRKDDFILIELAEIVRDAVDISRPRWRDDAEALAIKYEVEVHSQFDAKITINGEPSELREVFVNIILNALDAMPIGGSLIITVSADDSTATVSFADTGVGMTEEIKRCIFDPFFTTKGVAGLGMGLSESYRIIERHSGRIEVETKLRQGTTFTIALPRVKPAEVTICEESAIKSARAAAVLVIDDEAAVRSVLAAILEEQGHQVSAAAGAEEAMTLLESHDFEVVFTDLAMPRTDGVTAAAQIKARKPATKVVLMSGYGVDKASELAGNSNSIDATISKPFRIGEIHEVMRKLLE